MTNGSSLISGYFDGTLSEAEVAELNAWIAADPANARLFAKHALLHSQMHEVLASERSLRVEGVGLPGQGTGARPRDPEAEFRHASALASERVALSGARHGWRITPRVWAIATAAAILLLVGGIGLFAYSHAGSALIAQEDDDGSTRSGPAYITADAGAVWDGLADSDDRQLTAGKPLTLKEGYAELTFADGGKIVVQSPAILTVNSGAAMTLSAGRIAAVVTGGGFSVNTPNAVVRDLGTEFGVAVDGSGTTRVEVFKGRVQTRRAVPAAPENANQKPVLLTAGEAATISSDSLIVDARGASMDHFIRGLATVTRSLDVVDLLCGGDGTTRRRGIAINVLTGQAGQLQQIGRENGDDKFHPVSGIPAVDGCFIPDGSAGPMQIDSGGDQYLFPETSKISQGLLWAGGRTLDPFGNGLARSELGGIDYSETEHGLVYMYTNKGVTLNLQKIRQMHHGAVPYEFRCILGNTFIKSVRRQRTAPRADLYVLVDGELRYERLGFSNRSGAIPVNVRLKPGDRFLTVVTTEGSDTQKDDFVILGDPSIELMRPEKQPASQHAADE